MSCEFEFRARAFNSLQICSLKPSEPCTISFTFCVFLCYDVSFELRYLSSVYVAKNASATAVKNRFCSTASLIQYGDIYHDGLIPSTTETSEISPSTNMQNRLYCQNIHSNVIISLTSFLTNQDTFYIPV